MIKLNELLMFTEAKELRVDVPVSRRLTARITVHGNQPAELEDLVELYGDYDVFSLEPFGTDGVLKIELKR